MLRWVHGSIEKNMVTGHSLRELERFERRWHVIKETEIKNDIELATEYRRTHLPEIEHPKLHVLGAHDLLDEICLLDKFGTCIEPYHSFGAEKRAFGFFGSKP